MDNYLELFLERILKKSIEGFLMVCLWESLEESLEEILKESLREFLRKFVKNFRKNFNLKIVGNGKFFSNDCKIFWRRSVRKIFVIIKKRNSWWNILKSSRINLLKEFSKDFLKNGKNFTRKRWRIFEWNPKIYIKTNFWKELWTNFYSKSWTKFLNQS